MRDAILQWQVTRPGLQPWGLPVVAETWDGRLNDINGFHVKPEHVLAALDNAKSGPVQEGNVGGGTGMVCHGFKGGIGTASRKLPAEAGGYTVGVLVQCNYGLRQHLRVAGVPVGKEIPDLMPGPAAAGTDVSFSTAVAIKALRVSATSNVGWIGVALENIPAGQVGRVCTTGSITAVKVLSSASTTAGGVAAGSATAGSATVTAPAAAGAVRTLAEGAQLGIQVQPVGTGANQSGSTTQSIIIIAQA